jgi:hypothetical protein
MLGAFLFTQRVAEMTEKAIIFVQKMGRCTVSATTQIVNCSVKLLTLWKACVYYQYATNRKLSEINGLPSAVKGW